MDLSLNGNAVALADSSTSKQGFDMTLGEDAYIYYAYSDEYDIYVKKINNIGDVSWTIPAVTNSTDDIVQAIYPAPASGCVIIYESQSWLEGAHIYAIEVSESGQVQSALPVSNLSGDQYYEDSDLTENGIFISYKDNTSGNYDVYGQHILFDGNLLSESGIAIADGADDQKESAVAYDAIADKVLVCYESPDGSETDLLCNEVDLSIPEVGDELVISESDYNQNNPFVRWSEDSFMIVWEDSRNTVALNSGVDIYFQEYKDGVFSFSSGGEAITTFNQKQERPIISQYTDDSFVIIWEDYRSTGKEFCANLYGQSFSSGVDECPDLGDFNYDGTLNVLDIVQLANCILAGNCADQENGCAGDMNNDGVFNVLDIVLLANCVLTGNCSG